MNTKAFVLLIVAVLALGGGLGGSFAGGIALGKNQNVEAAQSITPPEPTTAPEQQASGQANPEALSDLRQRFQSGQVSQEEIAQLREQFGGQLGPGGGGQRFGGGGGGGGGLTGTIESIEGNILTVNTAQGPLQATVGTDTIIQRFAEGTLADLLEGMRVTVSGEPGEGGGLQATSIFLVGEGADGGFGGGLPFGGRRLQQSP